MADAQDTESVKLPKKYVNKVRKNKKATGISIGAFICQAVDLKLSLTQDDIDTLKFINARLINVYNESNHVDFMVKFSEVIKKLS